ncbi:MAG: hypothetical protein ACSHYF_12205 [Verrucomicrobiaceae bacterium]
MKSLLLTLLSLSSLSAVTFEKLSINHAGADHHATNILSLDPLVVDAFEPIDGTFYYSHLVWGKNGPNPYLILDTNTPPAPGQPANNLETFNSTSGGGNFYLVHSLKIDDVTRADGLVFKYTGLTTTEYIPRAKAAIANGETHRFSYALPHASDTDTIALIGYDDRFAHFVLKATDNNVQIIAQESVTDFPGGTGKFTRFGNYPTVSPDGSIIAFRGQESGNHTGLFLWTEANGIQTVGDSNGTLPDGSTSWGNLEDSSAPAVFGPNNTLYIRHTASGSLLSHANGTTTSILKDGDLVNGKAVSNLGGFGDLALNGLKPLPNGDLVYLDGTRLLKWSANTWTEVIDLRNGLAPNHSYPGGFQITPQHFYFGYAIYDPNANVQTHYVARIDYQGGNIEGVYQFDPAEVNNELNRVYELYIGNDTLIIGKSGSYFATQLSTIPPVDVSPPPPVTFTSYVANLPANQQGQNDDPDGDGMNNLIEFALKLDPAVPNALSDGFTISVLTAPYVGLPGEDLYIRLEVNIHQEATGFTVTPRLYDTLDGPASPVDNIEAYNNPFFYKGRLIQLYRSKIPVNNLPTGYFRLHVGLDN